MMRIIVAEDSPYLQELQAALSRLGAGVFPRTQEALLLGAKTMQARWKEFAGGGSLPGIMPLKKPSGTYARSIKTRRIGAFEHEIYSEAPIADWIEHGTSDLDMKTTHPFGRRSRVIEPIVSKRTGKVVRKGGSYLIIPFQWGTPGTGFKNIMPVTMYRKVKEFKKMATAVSADSPMAQQSPNARGEMVGRARYNARSEYDVLQGAEYGNMEGMVRSTDSTGKNRSGGYFTFRIISTNSPANSWKRKGMTARPVTEAVAYESQEAITQMVESAMIGDLKNL